MGFDTLDASRLREWPLPPVPQDADKEERGQVLVIGGSREIPGAAILAGTAALRAGAGKLVIATAKSVAIPLAIAMPEARVIALPEHDDGSLAPEGIAALEACIVDAAAILAGPGFIEGAGTVPFIVKLLARAQHTPVILDASAMNVAKGGTRLGPGVLLTPHAGEMAALLDMPKQQVLDDAASAVMRGADAWDAIVALKGASTLIAAPGGRGRWQHDAGHPGLGTSGSGDVLAGLIAGLAARGAPLEQAAAWGVIVHALAGAKLAKEHGPVGYLARELAAEVPALLRDLQKDR